MKRFTVAEFRKNLAQAFQAADSGRKVLVDRKGRSYLLIAQDAPKGARKSVKPFFVATDLGSVENGWSWDWAASGKLRLKSGRGKR